MPRRFWVTLGAALLTSAALSSMCRAEAPAAPLQWPVAPTQAGTWLAAEARVLAPQRYAVRLVFHITTPNRFSSWFDRESADEARRLHALLGGATKAEDGSWHEAGVPGTFRVRVTDARTGTALIDQTATRPGTQAVYMGRTAQLTELPLAAGTYLIQVEALNAGAELAPLHTFVSFSPSHHGK
ncbi:MAG: hypothetical protein RI907_1869 [Pseudomonadota bacterium]|jgi:hypothetical protein